MHSSIVFYPYFGIFFYPLGVSLCLQVSLFVHSLSSSIALCLPIFYPLVECLHWPSGWCFWGRWPQRQGAEQGGETAKGDQKLPPGPLNRRKGGETRDTYSGCKPDEVSVTLRTESVEKARPMRSLVSCLGKTGSHKSPIKKEQTVWLTKIGDNVHNKYQESMSQSQ